MWTYNYTTNDELYHYGTLGMRWGIRRYQNKDGTLTAAGRRRKLMLEADYNRYNSRKKNKDIKKKYLNPDGTLTEKGKKRKRLIEEDYAILTGERINKKKSKTTKPKTATPAKDHEAKKDLKSKFDDKIEKQTEQATSNKIEKQTEHKTKSDYKTDKSKAYKDFSDDELRTATDRMNAESNYLIAQQKLNSITPKQTSKGKEIVSYVAKNVVAPVAVNVGKDLLEKKLRNSFLKTSPSYKSLYDELNYKTQYENLKELREQTTKQKKQPKWTSITSY